MTHLVLDGRAVAREMRIRALDELNELQSRYRSSPSLWILSVGKDPSAQAYQRAIFKAARGVHLQVESIELPVTSSQENLIATIDRLNADDAVTGVIVLQPLPPHISRVAVSDRLNPLKDIDGITTFNAGRLFHDDRDVLAPSTPAGGMALLKHYGVEIEGQHAVVVGRSPVVGKPMSLMLLAENATVTMCHSRTRDLAEITREADILVSAVGRPGTIKKHMVKPGAAVVDFGVNFIDGAMIGDVDFDAVRQVARAITPVPGGTGRVTTMVLVRNTLKAMRLQHEDRAKRERIGMTSQNAKGMA
jgi:methylenetetrahydrofolate dehydrogenase (NADP+) / methenyltetrahydrofolate cyclohydrolase